MASMRLTFGLMGGAALGLTLAGAALAAPAPASTLPPAINPAPLPTTPVPVRSLPLYYADPGHADIAGFYRQDPAHPPVFIVGGKPLPGRDAHDHQLGLPYKPDWQKALNARYAADLKGLPYGDPNNSCWPPGIVGEYMVEPNGVEIMETPNLLTLIFERQSTMRWIHTDGRPHASGEDVEPTLKGDSIGHWDGDVLVADTTEIRNEPTLGFNLPHSDQLHVVERFKRVDADTLEIHIALTDPQAFTKPVDVALTYKKADPNSIVEKICLEENMGKTVDANLVVHPDTRVKKHYGFDLPNPH